MAKRNKQSKRDAKRSSIFRGRTPAEDAEHRQQRREGIARQQAMRSANRYDEDDDFKPVDPNQSVTKRHGKGKKGRGQSQYPAADAVPRHSPPSHYNQYRYGGHYQRQINGARVDAIAEELFGPSRHVTAESIKRALADRAK